VRTRERLERKIGKAPAAAYAMLRTLRHEAPVRIRYGNKTLQTSLFFLGNSTYQPSGFAPAQRNRVDDGLIDVRILENGRPFSKIRVMTAMMADGWYAAGCITSSMFRSSTSAASTGQPPLHLMARWMDSTRMRTSASVTEPFRCFAPTRDTNREADLVHRAGPCDT
jgi:hypothetical protein